MDSFRDGKENSEFRSVGEVEGKLVGEGEDGGSGNLHCCIVWR